MFYCINHDWYSSTFQHCTICTKEILKEVVKLHAAQKSLESLPTDKQHTQHAICSSCSDRLDCEMYINYPDMLLACSKKRKQHAGA
jgi:hypothetical protein